MKARMILCIALTLLISLLFGAGTAAAGTTEEDLAWAIQQIYALQTENTFLKLEITVLEYDTDTLETDLAWAITEIYSLGGEVALLDSDVDDLATDLDTLDGNTTNVQALDPYLIVEDYYTVNEVLPPHVIFSGVNVHIWNDDQYGQTDYANGLGNLIIGYNESDETEDRGGSHNLVIGPYHEYPTYGGLVAGYGNIISGDYASVSGGQENTANGAYSSITGGRSNTTSASRSSISGGRYNETVGYCSNVSGGYNNTAGGNGNEQTVCGGAGNTAYGPASNVGGGTDNEATGWYSTVSGGWERSVSGMYDWRGGSKFSEQ